MMVGRAMSLLRGLACAVAMLLAGCSSPNPYYNASKPHHRPNGFQNIDPAAWMPKPFGDFARWQWNRFGVETPAPKMDLSAQVPDLGFIRKRSNHFSVTWVGHATVLLQIGTLNVLTDPIFSERASPVQWLGPKRHQPPALLVSELPRIDVVLISHSHYDHLDEASVLALNQQAGGPPLFIVPLGIERWLAKLGITNSRALDWWDQHKVGDATIHLVPVQHWGRRTLTDTNTMLWGGFVVEGVSRGKPRKVFFSGDTGYSKQHFNDIGAKFGSFDLALIAIGAYEPRWFMSSQHVNPDEAVQIHLDVRSARSIGIHWGTFQLTDEPLDQAVRDLAESRKRRGLPERDFGVLKHGETLRLDALD
jgi:N-acyl-phosphatidylethanolamine-hydrolysing phospholipase D